MVGIQLGLLRGCIKVLDPRMKETLGGMALLCLKLLAEREFPFTSRLYLLWSSYWQLFSSIITKIGMKLLGKIPKRVGLSWTLKYSLRINQMERKETKIEQELAPYDNLLGAR